MNAIDIFEQQRADEVLRLEIAYSNLYRAYIYDNREDMIAKYVAVGNVNIPYFTDSIFLNTKQTMVAYMSEAELDRLCGYITEYSLGDTPREVSPVSVDSALKSIDLMHFGWNIGKAFGKKRIHTATFIKRVFAHALRDIEVSTIERKMSHTESECRIKLNNNIW